MNRTLHTALLLLLSVGMAVGCASIGSNPLAAFVHAKPDFKGLPQDALKAVALEIEKGVAEGNREPAIADRDGVVVSSELVRQCLRTRAARFERLDEFLGQGYGVEGSNGLVYISKSKDYKKATSRKQRDRDAQLVLSENEDRWTLFEGIIKSSGFPSGSLSAIQDIFHEARVETMRDGQQYENAENAVLIKGQ